METVRETLLTLYTRDLDKLAAELGQYPNDESVWRVQEGIANPAGNLCLHLCGNLRHFIGAILGKDGYVRNRDAEFADKNIPRKILLEEIERTKAAISKTLPSVSDEQLKATYPIDVFGHPMTTAFFLIHLSTHLGYHLGQVNYHRRLVGRSS